MSNQEALDELFNEEFKDEREIILRQYQLYAEQADQISARRALANGFHLTANGIIIALLGLMIQNALFFFLIPISIIGLLFSASWIMIIYLYKKLNWAKFEVINKIEEILPVKGFSIEWKLLKRSLYRPLTHVEVLFPSFLFAGYAVVLFFSIVYMIPYIFGFQTLV